MKRKLNVLLIVVFSFICVGFICFSHQISVKPGGTTAQPEAVNTSIVHKAMSFSTAKKKLMKIYRDHRVTFYCGCEFNAKKNIDSQKCGYEPRKSATRGSRVEWEHIVPAWRFGHKLKCWKNAKEVCGKSGGRKCCSKIDSAFKKLITDMNNLAPAVGETNGDRSNFPYGEIPGEKRLYGQCDFEVDFKRRIAEPAESIRGDIARTYLHMNDRFKLLYGEALLSKKERKRYIKWSHSDPVDKWECVRNRRIKVAQGYGNLYVEIGCLLE